MNKNKTHHKNRFYLVLVMLTITGMLFCSVNIAASVYAKQFQKLQAKAESGDKKAQYKLGVAYMRGSAIKYQPKKAIKWFKKSAAKGYVKALFRIGQIHYDRRYGMLNHSIAFKWFSKAARKNHGQSQYYMALMYRSGKGTHKDMDYAMIWAKRAEKNGVAGALLSIRNKSARKTRTTPRLTLATHSPAVRKSRSRRRNVAPTSKLNTRKLLIAGGWNRGENPSHYIPSHTNKCKNLTKRNKIRCTSKRLIHEGAEYTAHYKIVSVIGNFTPNGSFDIFYKRKFIFVLPDDADDPNPKSNIPAIGLEEATSILKCKTMAKNRIHCYKADKSFIILKK